MGLGRAGKQLQCHSSAQPVDGLRGDGSGPCPVAYPATPPGTIPSETAGDPCRDKRDGTEENTRE